MSGTTDVFADVEEFTRLYCEKTNRPKLAKIDRKFITQMILDELEELKEAKDETEEVDALLDLVYYALQHLSMVGIPSAQVWQLIHQANLTKFGPGGYFRPDGKWCKPPNFVPPDDAIRHLLQKWRQ